MCAGVCAAVLCVSNYVNQCTRLVCVFVCLRFFVVRFHRFVYATQPHTTHMSHLLLDHYANMLNVKQ